MKKLILILILLVPITMAAQMRPMGQNPFMAPMERLFYEVSSLPSENAGKSTISISIKAPYEFLVFTKSPERTAKDFIGSFDITIEIFDKNKNSIDRRIKQEIKELSNDEKKLLRDKFYEASFSFDVNPGDYNISIEFNDRESDNSIRKEVKLFKAKDYKTKTLSDILFYPSFQVDSTHPVNFTSNIPFGENCILYSEMSGYDPQSDKLVLKMYKLKDKKQDSILSFQIPKENILKKSASVQNGNINTNEIYEIKLPLKTDTFEISKYEMTIESSSQDPKYITKKMFEIQWFKMPFSLRDFEMAQKYLKLITTTQEFDMLQSGSKTEQREKFLDFWKKRDPTPLTAYNELMTEFYKRVDYSIMNFSTVSVPDGSSSDRGKAFILYGKPDNTERTLIPNEAPTEVWTYQKLGKKYIFVDDSRQGNYKLSAVEKL